MAAFLSQSEISVGLFRGMMYLFGPMNGGIALAVIVMCAIEAACTGDDRGERRQHDPDGHSGDAETRI